MRRLLEDVILLLKYILLIKSLLLKYKLIVNSLLLKYIILINSLINKVMHLKVYGNFYKIKYKH